MTTPRQGEVWWAEAEDKRRPVLVVTRTEAIPLGADEGLPVDCAASFDNVQPVERRLLTRRVGVLPPQRRHEICRALDA